MYICFFTRPHSANTYTTIRLAIGHFLLLERVYGTLFRSISGLRQSDQVLPKKFVFIDRDFLAIDSLILVRNRNAFTYLLT